MNPARIAKHYLTPALAALGLAHVRWHDLRHAFAVMSLSAGEHRMRRREGRAGGASGRVDRAERGPNASAAAG